MQFSDELIEVFDYIGGKVGIAIDWSDKNVIPYLTELASRFIKYQITTSGIWLGISVIILLLIVPVYKKYVAAKNRHKTNSYDDSYIEWFWAIVFISIVGIMTFGTNLFQIVECVYLPELTIYEYITSFIETSH